MRIAIARFLMAGAAWSQDLCSDVAAIDKFAKELTMASYTKPQLRYEVGEDELSQWHGVRKWEDENADKALVYAAKTELPLKVGMLFNSESGDWVQEIEFYFRADGSLAKRYENLRTFYGNVTAHRYTWFDCNGKELKSERKFFELGAKKRTTPDGDFQDEPFPPYKRLKDLPFYSLLPH